jgi:ATP-dependent DNA ligase
MKYDNYSYIYPPRPKNTTPSDSLSRWDNGTMIAQPKINGSNCVIFMNSEKTFVMNRHNQRLTNFQIDTEELKKIYKGNGWLVINGEYLNKSKREERGQIFNHKLVIFDILVYESDYLIGKSFIERIDLLDNLYGTDDSEKDYLYKITENIYRVKSYDRGFDQLYKKLTPIDMVEGLVMKRKNARLERGLTESNNSNSQVKSRKPTKNYRF